MSLKIKPAPRSLLPIAAGTALVLITYVTPMATLPATASVHADRAAMGSGANNTARYFGAAVGITLFVVIATHVGDDLAAGWNVAVLVSAAISLFGAAGVAIAGRTARHRALP